MGVNHLRFRGRSPQPDATTKDYVRAIVRKIESENWFRDSPKAHIIVDVTACRDWDTREVAWWLSWTTGDGDTHRHVVPPPGQTWTEDDITLLRVKMVLSLC